VKNYYRLKLTIAIFWLLLIYLFIPFAPDFVNFFFERFGLSFVARSLTCLSVLGALLAYLPFIRKFKLKNLTPYIIITAVLIIACAINISLKVPAETLHIPEYAILTIFLYRAFIVKYHSKKSAALAITIGAIAGIIDEAVIQHLLPNRVSAVSDTLLNVAGVMVGIFLISAYRLRVV